jgi:hypothetical protein
MLGKWKDITAKPSVLECSSVEVKIAVAKSKKCKFPID